MSDKNVQWFPAWSEVECDCGSSFYVTRSTEREVCVDDLKCESCESYENGAQEGGERLKELQAENERLKSELEIKHTQLKGTQLAEAALKLKLEQYESTPERDLKQVAVSAVELFKDEMLRSTKAMLHPHIEGVFAVVERRLTAEDIG